MKIAVTLPFVPLFEESVLISTGGALKRMRMVTYPDRKRYYTFAQFLKEKIGTKVRKVSVNAGFTCPNRDGTAGFGGCIYCYNPGFTPSRADDCDSVTLQIEKQQAIMRKRGFQGKFLAYFQPYSNTYAHVDTLNRLYGEALRCEDMIGLAIGTRPDCVPDKVLSLLEQYARKHHIWVEYGLQSAHDSTLENLNRGHDFAQFEDAVRRTQNRGVYICAHIILGLPGEGKEQMLETVRRLSILGIDGVKLHHLQVVKGTELEKRYRQGNIRVLVIEEYVPLLCDILENLPPNVVVHRLVGEIRDELLLAPCWAVPKTQIVHFVEKELERRGSFQGIFFEK